jgi:hypothetical protein
MRAFCPRCGQAGNIPPHLVGKSIRCPKCRHRWGGMDEEDEPKESRSSVGKVIIVLACGSIALIGGLAIGLGFSEAGKVVAPALSPAESRLTMRRYLAIENGMSYEQVEGIMGFPGVEQSSTTILGMESKMVSWSGGGTITVLFQNDRVASKSQLGLK